MSATKREELLAEVAAIADPQHKAKTAKKKPATKKAAKKTAKPASKVTPELKEAVKAAWIELVEDEAISFKDVSLNEADIEKAIVDLITAKDSPIRAAIVKEVAKTKASTAVTATITAQKK